MRQEVLSKKDGFTWEVRHMDIGQNLFEDTFQMPDDLTSITVGLLYQSVTLSRTKIIYQIKTFFSSF